MEGLAEELTHEVGNIPAVEGCGAVLGGREAGTATFKKYGDHRVFVVEALGIEPKVKW